MGDLLRGGIYKWMAKLEPLVGGVLVLVSLGVLVMCAFFKFLGPPHTHFPQLKALAVPAACLVILGLYQWILEALKR